MAAVAAVMAVGVVAGAIKPLTRSKEAYKGCLADSQTALYLCADNDIYGENTDKYGCFAVFPIIIAN